MGRAFTLTAAAVTAVLLATGAATAAPNDTCYGSYQWGLTQIHAEQAWSVSTGAGQVIAIVDSGVDLGHPDLAGKIVGGATFTCAAAAACGNGDWQSGAPRGSRPRRTGRTSPASPRR